VAVSIDTESIIDVLNRLCKTDVPDSVHAFIRQCTCTFGKAKLVLKENKFYVESAFPDVLRELLRLPTISAARIPHDYDASLSDDERARRARIAKSVAKQGITKGTGDDDDFVRSLAPQEIEQNLEHTKLGSMIDKQQLQVMDDAEDDDDEDFGASMGGASSGGQKSTEEAKQNVSFRIHQDHVQEVKRVALAHNYPLMEEYDFKNDTFNPTLQFDLKPTTRIRLYQEKSLSKMFGNGRARSGIIVLPCGAGKSLTGVTAASTIKKSTMILCPNNVSVKQWKEQFLQWTTMSPSVVRMFTAEYKDRLPPKSEACILLSTYTMISYSGERAAEAKPIIEAIKEREWGLMILDEVHLAPARVFRKVMNMVNAHCKLGLTATLVREDNLITDLNFLIGPKLYEANWMDLTQQGYLANVQCAEVWCPMTAEFFREYLKSANKTHRVQRLLYILNPTKIRVCEYLMKYHTHADRGDKVIIFADDVVALELICTSMGVPFIIGKTQEEERREFISKFKNTSSYPCLGLSSVGDAALDIPEANVIIQVSSHFGQFLFIHRLAS
jgi:DNA excision repair protein ERCC-3